jgi:L-lactate dehydrogenase complex protein LldG
MTHTSKETILARIRNANQDTPSTQPITHNTENTPRPTYRTSDQRDHETIIEEFIDRLTDYKATVTRCISSQLQEALDRACQQHAITRLAVPADIPAHWLPSSLTLLRDDPPLSVHDLDNSDGVLTGCALAIAQTGTIVLDGGAQQGRRALTLVPDRHLCVVYAQQVVGLVPEAISRLQPQHSAPITFISGPSATSDIELSRVEGVHGPRTLHVFVVADSASLL